VPEEMWASRICIPVVFIMLLVYNPDKKIIMKNILFFNWPDRIDAFAAACQKDGQSYHQLPALQSSKLDLNAGT
jgi:hypothetical protein